MRFAFIDDFVPVVLEGDRAIDVSDLLESIPRLRPQDLLAGLAERFDEFRPALQEAAGSREGKPIDSVRFRPPVPQPGKMVCMAGNYMESGTIPEALDVDAFLKAPSSVIAAPPPSRPLQTL